MLELIKRFESIISSFNILLYEQEAKNSRLRLKIIFIDGSKLFVRDYYFSGGDRKYVFHWMDKDSNLIVGWDNAEHWPSIPTFPHHKHVRNEKTVKSSTEVLLEDVLDFIAKQLIP